MRGRMSPLTVDKAINALVGVGPDTKFANYRRLGLRTHGDLKGAFVQRAGAVGQHVVQALHADLSNLDDVMGMVPPNNQWKHREWDKLYPKAMQAYGVNAHLPFVQEAMAAASGAAFAESRMKAEEAIVAQTQKALMKTEAASGRGLAPLLSARLAELQVSPRQNHQCLEGVLDFFRVGRKSAF